MEKEEVVDLFPDSFTNTFPFHGRFSFFVDLSNNRVFNMCGFEETLGYKEETWNVDHLLFSDFIHPDHLIHFYSIIRSTLEFDFSKYKHNPVSIHFKLMVKSKSGEYLKFFVSSGPTLVAKSNGAFAGGYYECTLVHGMADSFNFGWDITGDPELVQSFKESMKKRMSVLLTKRELEVLQYLKEGLSSKMIADKLGIAKNTVDNFRSSLLKKSSAGNTAQLISVAQKNGWI
ncbi:MAG: LuxR C-terminal-related transcriptional regulator [Bacteroidota bacterium]